MTDKTNSEFIPRFKIAFLYPRYWGAWLAVLLFALVALVPAVIRDPLLAGLGKLVARLNTKACRRAKINLYYCFPEWTEVQRMQVIERMFIAAPQAIVFMARLVLWPAKRVRRQVIWHNYHIIEEMERCQQRVIFLVPHGWGVDIPGMLLAESGHSMAAMFHNQGNEVFDYIWNVARGRFGGRLHARRDGIKHFVQSIRQGYWGYYLPDEDYGAQQSHFVDFFATYKATLPAVGRLMKVCRARIIPMFPVYDGKNHRLEIFIRSPMDDLVSADEVKTARRMNEEVEQLVEPYPEQYTWLLRLLRTRREGEIEPYQREDLY